MHEGTSIAPQRSPFRSRDALFYSVLQERQSKPVVTDQRRRTHFNTETELDGVFMYTMHVDDWTLLSFREWNGRLLERTLVLLTL